MRIKIIGGLFLLLAIGIGVVGFSKSKSLDVVALEKASAAQGQTPQDLPGTINGAEHPELIPDHVAYAMLFRLIANREEESSQRSIRAYIRQIFRCEDCEKTPGQGKAQSNNPDIDALLAVAQEHHERIGVLDRQAATLKGRSWPDPAPEVMAKLTELQTQNDALSAALANSLSHRLSAKGMGSLRQHIVERVKPNIKIVPGPQPPPGSDYYQLPPPAGSAPPTHHGHHQTKPGLK